MARPLRIDRPGAWYHVTARGIERRVIFRNDADRRHWLELLPEFVHRFRLRLHSYVMMDNHFHLLVEALEGNLSVAMQCHLNPIRIKPLGLDKRGRAADRLGVRGKLEAATVQDRLKPLRAFRWSSYRAYLGP